MTVQVPGTRHSRLLGVGAYLPERVVTNDEICERIDSSDQWIQERSGIRERRRAAADETVVDMAEHAARQAIAAAGIEPRQIDTVIMATVTHPYQTPAAAPLLADRLGTRAAAWDVSAACAGYCYGIACASDLVKAGTATYALVVGVEKLSDFVDFTERGVAFIFGDGAGAAVVGPSDEPGIGPTVWGSSGADWAKIQQRGSWLEINARTDAGLPAVDEHGLDLATFTMAGQSVFRWAVFEMAPVVRKALEAAGVSVDDLAAFIPHQANMRIIDAMLKQLHLPEHVVVARDIAFTANTSSASVPIATTHLLQEHPELSGQLALEFGFGGGLVYAAQVVRLP